MCDSSQRIDIFPNRKDIEMLKFLKERAEDYDTNRFVNELVDASMALGVLNAKIAGCKYNRVLLPMLHQKEIIATMGIEGIQTTFTEMLEEEVSDRSTPVPKYIEYKKHWLALMTGADRLRLEDFSHRLIEDLHGIMLKGSKSANAGSLFGQYKERKNLIGVKDQKDGKIIGRTVIFEPPPPQETRKYMNELVEYINNHRDGVNPLIKAAISHAQFESIHPFEDGNGRLGRILITLYLYKAELIQYPYFYMSEAFLEDRLGYYAALTSSRGESLNDWISFFLKKVSVQARKHARYMDALDVLYEKTKSQVKDVINSPKFEAIIECIFRYPCLTSATLAEHINVSLWQAKRYLNTLESQKILVGADMKRHRRYFFAELLDLMR